MRARACVFKATKLKSSTPLPTHCHSSVPAVSMRRSNRCEGVQTCPGARRKRPVSERASPWKKKATCAPRRREKESEREREREREKERERERKSEREAKRKFQESEKRKTKKEMYGKKQLLLPERSAKREPTLNHIVYY